MKAKKRLRLLFFPPYRTEKWYSYDSQSPDPISYSLIFLKQINHGDCFSESGQSPKPKTPKSNLTGIRDCKRIKLWKLAFKVRSKNTERKRDGQAYNKME